MNLKTPTSFFFWKGSPIPFEDGESVAIALSRSGINQFEADNSFQNKSVFCGIGQCQGCTVLVEGTGKIEACLTPCEQDLQVKPLPAFEKQT